MRRFGNPLRKFFCGFGFVEFLMRSAPLPKGDWGLSVVVVIGFALSFLFGFAHALKLHNSFIFLFRLLDVK
jgi:hypothetical protein